MNKLYTKNEVHLLLGINISEPDDLHLYEAKWIDVDQLPIDVINNHKMVIDQFKSDYIEHMVNRLKLNGHLPAIILSNDMNLRDGSHRLISHLIAESKIINVLITHKNIE